VIAATESSGYIDELLRLLGVPPATAGHIQDLLLRPLTIGFVLLITYLIARFGSGLVRRTVNRAGRRMSMSPGDSDGLRLVTVGRIVADVWRVAVWIVGGITVLSVIGIDLAPFLAGATVLGATIGFGAQSLVRDFLSGFLMLVEDQFRIGDVVSVGDVSGTVEEVSLRITRLRDADGTAWYIPNGQILRLGNTSRHWTRSRVVVFVSPTAPLNRAMTLIDEASRAAIVAQGIEDRCVAPPQVLGVSDTTPDGIGIDVEVQVLPGAADLVARALRAGISEALAAEGWLAGSAPTVA
jgi:small-conductance mechanosensitive channel